MTTEQKFCNFYESAKIHLFENSVTNLIWIINLVPRTAGFSITEDKSNVLFFIIHLSSHLYVYVLGIIVYQIKYAHGLEDVLISFENVSLSSLILSCTFWFLNNKPFVKELLNKITRNDKYAVQSEQLKAKYEKRLGLVKIIVLCFYAFNILDAILIYLPNRFDPSKDFSMVPCVGMGPFDKSPRRQICSFILVFQELCIMVVVLNYQALLLFFIAHTTVMYQLLSDEMLLLLPKDLKDMEEAAIRSALSVIIDRHSLNLEIISFMKALYSTPIGINFACNALCISLFFLLPMRECVKFIPVFGYAFLTFFLYCYLCQRLINAAETYQDAVYNCGWENFNLKEKKTVYLMLLMAQKPVELLAADIIPINIYTFATTLQFMYKFVTILKF